MRGEEIALSAMKKELSRLQKIAAKHKADVDRYLNVGKEKIAIYEELRLIVASKEYGKGIIDKLDKLEKRDKAAKKIMNSDFTAMSEKQYQSEYDVQSLASEVSRLELIIGIRNGKYN